MPVNPHSPAAGELPPPSPEARAHSEQLALHIREAIAAAGGRVDFARFMELALYAPGLGYYSAGSRKFGAGGDFVTAPEISPLFSRCLARQCEEVLAALGGGGILEFGAGTGRMAAELLLELESLGRLPERYAILELSAELRQRQRETLAARAPQLLGRVEWLDTLPEGLRGVILANEVLDAMPVQRFRIENGVVRQLYVQVGAGGFEWVSGEVTTPPLGERVEALAPLPEGYTSEVGLAAEEWVRGLGSVLAEGAALLIDYGFPRHEFYHPQRAEGTLMCHYRHRAHPNPFFLVGLQDITAHVDFTAVAEAALAGGLSVRGFANQANFLLGNGLTELLTAADAGEQLQLAAQVKTLTLPGEMGELFKVMGLTRGLEIPLRGFALRDERGRL